MFRFPPTSSAPAPASEPSKPEHAKTTHPKVVDLRQHRLLRLIQEARRQQVEVAKFMRDSAADSARIAESLQNTQRQLTHLAEGCTTLLTRMDRDRRFRDACQQAAELDDLDEMIRRRDALAEEMKRLHRPLLSEAAD